MLCDTHCHLDMIPDPKIALLRAKEAGVGIIINVGTSIEASRKSIEIAENTDLVDVYATCGIHAQEGPKDIKKYGDGFLDELKKIARFSKRVVGIGECGMDYFLE
ncbi:MAG: TatD family hydrolase, partial [Candidatus Curtissbacteria bacterium]